MPALFTSVRQTGSMSAGGATILHPGESAAALGSRAPLGASSISWLARPNKPFNGRVQESAQEITRVTSRRAKPPPTTGAVINETHRRSTKNFNRLLTCLLRRRYRSRGLPHVAGGKSHMIRFSISRGPGCPLTRLAARTLGVMVEATGPPGPDQTSLPA